LEIFEMSDENTSTRRILRGARAIAKHMGDEALALNIRRHPEEWPVFLIGNVLVGYADAIDAAILEKERAGLSPLRPLTRKRPAARLELTDA
jgi:hypothetical protein